MKMEASGRQAFSDHWSSRGKATREAEEEHMSKEMVFLKECNGTVYSFIPLLPFMLPFSQGMQSKAGVIRFFKQHWRKK